MSKRLSKILVRKAQKTSSSRVIPTRKKLAGTISEHGKTKEVHYTIEQKMFAREAEKRSQNAVITTNHKGLINYLSQSESQRY